jgi:hypothetical protein
MIGGERRGPVWRRSADGRLKPAQEADIADIWAEQKRIQLKEAIDDQKRRALKKQRRKERGLFGLKRPAVQTQAAPGQHEIEIRLSLPKLRLARHVIGWLRRVMAAMKNNRPVVFVALVVAVLLIGVVGLKMLGKDGGRRADSGKHLGKTSVLGTNQSEKPDYDTVLPLGKTIDQLGGWGRVSPPDRDPVFAYSDTLGGVHIVVSEQPLPSDFASDIPGKLASVAKQFSASKKLSNTDGSAVYVGTAANGSQSVVASKKGLLILIRSSGVLANELWADYIYALE